MTIEEWLNGDELGINIWKNKYRYNDESLDEWFDRVSGGDSELKERIIQKKFLFGGRTLANRGTNKGSLSNCYCSGRVEDSVDDIMNTAKKIALTFKAQGGQGLSLSNIRPKGAKIGETFESDGIVPFMEIFNTVTHSISQGGSRKGALMMSLDVEHPQIKDFITIKSDQNRINNANLSVEINDRFMKAVKWYYEHGETLTYKTHHYYKGADPNGYEVTPIEIYKLIMKHAWKDAEPGVMFMNRFSNYNLMEKVSDYVIYTSNPCGEQPLPKNGACNLSSINISEYVLNPFTEKSKIDYESLIQDIRIYVRAMNAVLDENSELHALPEQREFAKNYRNIGIGVMGVHDMLIKLGVKYGEIQSIVVIKELMYYLFRAAVTASSELASIYGSFPKYDDRIWDSEIIKRHFEEEEIERLKKYGLRNSSLLSIAPTGLMIGSV